MPKPVPSTHLSRRLLSLGLSLALAVAALLLARALAEAGAAAISPAPLARPAVVTFVVTTTTDAADNNLADGQCHVAPAGPCSLRAAVQQLSHDSGGAITLPPGTYNLTLEGASGGDLQLKQNISLNGAGPLTTIIQGNPISWTHRILRVQDGADALVSGVTISGGHLASLVGGGIDVITGTLTLSNSVVSNNTAFKGAGVYNTGQLNVEDSVVRGNQATYAGGGLYNDASNLAITPAAQLTVSLSSIMSNTASFGGGLYGNDPAARGAAQLTNSTLSGNQAVNNDGGGIYQLGGTVTLVASVLQLNTAFGSGGGLLQAGGVANVLISRIQSNTATIENGGGIDQAGGSLSDIGSTIIGNRSHGDGGGIASYGATFNLLAGGLLSNTSANVGGGLYVEGGSGTLSAAALLFNQAAAGGAGLYNAGGALAVTNNTRIDNNTTIAAATASSVNRPSTLGPGAGLYNAAGGTLRAQQLELAGNTGLGTGGGAINFGQMWIFSSTVSGNSAANGGGLYNALTGTLVISASTLSNNQALSAAGGGLANDGAGATTEMVNSTVDGNRSATNGGGLADEQGQLILSSVTVAANQADSDGNGTGNGGGLYNASVGSLQLRNSLVALNTDRGGQAPDCSGLLSSYDYNLVQSTAGCLVSGTTTNNIYGHDPKLLALDNYGGPTLTLALQPGSPAIDAGNPGGCRETHGILLPADQRGSRRSFDGNGDGTARCDIGAFELQWAARVFLPTLLR